MEEEYKMVIVMRKDLTMRAGKMVAQGGHAVEGLIDDGIEPKKKKLWRQSGKKKICVRVESEEELIDVLERAKANYLQTHLVIDSGLTEFGGVPTKTCIGIGPDRSSKIDIVTGALKLL